MWNWELCFVEWNVHILMRESFYKQRERLRPPTLLFILSLHVNNFLHVESYFFNFTPTLLSILSLFLLFYFYFFLSSHFSFLSPRCALPTPTANPYPQLTQTHGEPTANPGTTNPTHGKPISRANPTHGKWRTQPTANPYPRQTQPTANPQHSEEKEKKWRRRKNSQPRDRGRAQQKEGEKKKGKERK